MAHDVFISYSSKDKEAADTVCAELESNGIECWIAPRDIQPGEIYAQAIINGLSASRLMLFIFSSNSNESNHVASEIERAFSKRIPIIPVRIEDIPMSGALEYYLSSAQWFDASAPPLEESLRRLPETVRQLLKTKSAPKDFEHSQRIYTSPASSKQTAEQTNRQRLFNLITPVKVTVLLFLIVAALTLVYWLKPYKTDAGKNIVAADSFVVDTRSNLMWTKGDNGADINWSDAVKYCKSISLGGYSDWRLPSKLDLYATNDEAAAGADTIWKSLQLNKECCFWTSTEENDKFAWVFDLTPDTQALAKTDSKDMRALCVRHSEK